MPVVEPDALLVDEPPSVFPAVGDVFDHAVPMLLDEEGNAAAIFRSPVPQLMTRPGSIVSGDLLGNWVGDVTVGGCRLPRRRAASAAAELDASLIEAGVVRAGRTGTPFVAVADAKPPQGLLVEHALTGLSLRDPSMQVLLDALVPSGWSWQLSDAGRFYQGFADMIGGLPGLVAILRDRAAMPVLSLALSRWCL